MYPTAINRRTGELAFFTFFRFPCRVFCMIEQTVVLIKPDGVQKHIIGKIIDRFESKGLIIKALKMVQLTQPILDQWYAHHKDKPFFPSLCRDMMATPVVAMIVEGEGAIEKVFAICGPTDPAQALPGTIRRDFGESKPHNVVHRSDSAEAATREIGLLFSKEELFSAS
jgi:nucleoside-diphosphate kinase